MRAFNPAWAATNLSEAALDSLGCIQLIDKMLPNLRSERAKNVTLARAFTPPEDNDDFTSAILSIASKYYT